MLFPKEVVDQMIAASKPWKGMWFFPREMDLPVLVAVRMSLSFPLLFKAIPLWAEDHEYFRITAGLGGKPERRLRRMWMSHGGISSNFPIHMFDAPLSDKAHLCVQSGPVVLSTGRCPIPRIASVGHNDRARVQIRDISLASFAGQVFYSAKDWQDQLLSGITGQRERIARIYLAPDEGGLNLQMAPDVSRSLMTHGYSAGNVFTSGQFNFDEHRWRRTSAFYRSSTEGHDHAGLVWSSGYHSWYQGYAASAASYRAIRPRAKCPPRRARRDPRTSAGGTSAQFQDGQEPPPAQSWTLAKRR